MPQSQPPKPPKSLLRKVGRAIADYAMIRGGDRILLGVSGGKDSLSLLLILRHLQSYAPVRFDLGVITVDPEVEGFDPSSLTSYYDSLGLPWIYRQQPLHWHLWWDFQFYTFSRRNRSTVYVCQ